MPGHVLENKHFWEHLILDVPNMQTTWNNLILYGSHCRFDFGPWCVWLSIAWTRYWKECRHDRSYLRPYSYQGSGRCKAHCFDSHWLKVTPSTVQHRRKTYNFIVRDASCPSQPSATSWSFLPAASIVAWKKTSFYCKDSILLTRLNLPSEQRAEPLSDFIPITWDHSKFQGRKSMLNQLLLSFTASRPKDVWQLDPGWSSEGPRVGFHGTCVESSERQLQLWKLSGGWNPARILSEFPWLLNSLNIYNLFHGSIWVHNSVGSLSWVSKVWGLGGSWNFANRQSSRDDIHGQWTVKTNNWYC